MRDGSHSRPAQELEPMKYKSQAQLAEEARSLSAALAVAKLAGWSLDPLTSIAPKACRGFLHEPRCELVLIPYAAQSARSCDFGQVEERTLNA
ncbi:hypothetical protein [Sphingomonas sp. ID1715]|uniref:hypothetical protein n=1 Tax=Sphingomonas sp. ID1715 TaxID=1656898 RepID=UPI001C2C06E8|nr:hypothetical protein [Sphingomonas sp. ID1715]